MKWRMRRRLMYSLSVCRMISVVVRRPSRRCSHMNGTLRSSLRIISRAIGWRRLSALIYGRTVENGKAIRDAIWKKHSVWHVPDWHVEKRSLLQIHSQDNQSMTRRSRYSNFNPLALRRAAGQVRNETQFLSVSDAHSSTNHRLLERDS